MIPEVSPPRPPRLLTAPPSGKVLVVAPHPDDETLGLGGTLALHARQGDAVQVLVVCSGIEGDPDGHFERAEIAALREAECREACGLLGLQEPIFLGYPDNLGGPDLRKVFPDVPAEPDAARRHLAASFAEILAAQVADGGYEIVYLPWRGELNEDHWTIGRALDHLEGAHAALCARVAFMGYDVWTPLAPDAVIDISDVAALKAAAARRYRSQQLYHDYLPHVRGLDAYRALLLERGATFGEAFVGRHPRFAGSEEEP